VTKKDIELYKLVLEIWKTFGMDLMIEQVYHLFMSQKSKSLHQQITRVAPKDKHFSGTMALSDRVALVVITDSVGYEEGMFLIFDELGIELPDTTVQYLKRKNEHRAYQQTYRGLPENKTKRYSIKKANIRNELEQKAKASENGCDYHPSMYVDEILEIDEVLEDNAKRLQTGHLPEEQRNGPGVAVEATPTDCMNRKKPSIPRSQLKCNDCPLFGHKSMRSKMCKEHHRYLALHQR